VRYRLMATYQGSPFEAGIGPTDDDIVLFAACPPPEELGFEPATGHWRKQLRVADVQAVWESRPVGTFRGERCMVLDDLGDRLHIGYLGHDGFKAEQLGYWQVDRGVFELVAPRSEVSDILEERTEYPRQRNARRPATQLSGEYAAPGDLTLPRSPSTSGQYPAPSQPPTPRTSGQYPTPSQPPTPRTSGQYSTPAGVGLPGSEPVATSQPPAAYLPVPDGGSGIALPVTVEAPLPLEAEAMRAATASRRPRPAVRRGAPAIPILEAAGTVSSPPENLPAAPLAPALPERASIPTRQRRAARRRLATERLFADLAALAGIPAESYAVGEAVDGALCLVQTEQRFEVFHCAAGARHELQVFATEESAYFYLFGVLAAEAVRNGTLTGAAVPARLGAGQAQTA
jgi:hypothetical protein